MEEIWKEIKGYEGKYMVSNLGRIKCVARTQKWGVSFRRIKEKILKPRQKGRINPYLTIILYDNNKKDKTFHVHRLVALHFVSGFYKGADVNHKDGNKHNNISSNLEWVSRSYNIKHSYDVLGESRMKGRVVLQKTLDNNPICFYSSIKEASSIIGISGTSIGDCANGKIDSACGFKFSFI